MQTSSEIIPENIEFLGNNHAKIKEMFAPAHLGDTITKLENLERERANRLFSK